MTCFDGVLADPVFLGVAGVSVFTALVTLWMVKFQKFAGKLFYALTFVAVTWTLMMVGSEAATRASSCKFQFAILAWLGNALLPVGWCFFVFAYVDRASWLKKRWTYTVLMVVPIAVFAFAATNYSHHLVYSEATIIPLDQGSIDYVHGPGFFTIVAILYTFVLATLACLVRAFVRAKRAAWPWHRICLWLALRFPALPETRPGLRGASRAVPKACGTCPSNSAFCVLFGTFLRSSGGWPRQDSSC